jgi:hypothetical protein
VIVAGQKTVAGFALLGAISGTITTGALFALPEDWKIEVGDFLMLSPLSIEAGLVFGIIFGGLLRYRGLAGTVTAALYALASTASYFVAVNLALQLGDGLDEIWRIGMIAGLAGSACLTAAAAVLLPFVRQVRPIALMLVAGGLLGALLEVALADGATFWHWLVLFAPWQAGYAAAFATALPAVGAKG